MSAPTADELYRQGMATLPPWNYDGDDGDERFVAGVAVLREAAEAGSLDAADYLADGGEDDDERMRWCRLLAEMGEFSPLTSHLTDSERATIGVAVLAAARAGEAWAMVALADVYGMGMENGDGIDVATLDGSYGWMPGVADPAAEARRWAELASAAGFGPAHLWLADALQEDDAPRALDLVKAGLPWQPLHPVVRRRAERLLVELMDELEVDTAQRIAERERLAAAGDSGAMVWLADRFVDGSDGVVADPARARSMYAQAAAAGEVDALRELGRMCEEGLGGPVDLVAAKEHYEQAAEFGADRFARTRLVERWGLDWYAVAPDE